MNKTIIIVVLSLAVGCLSQGAPTITHPCLIYPTINQSSGFINSMPEQIRQTLIAARSADSTFQSFKNALRPVLISTAQCDLESSLENIPGLPLIDESIATTFDVLARTLRRSALNITIHYNLLEQVLNSGRMHTFNQHLGSVMLDILTVKCRILKTGQVIALNFTAEESERNNETMPADYEEFRLQTAVSQGSLAVDDEKSANCAGYTIARWVQRMLSILIGVLEAEQRSMEIQ